MTSPLDNDRWTRRRPLLGWSLAVLGAVVFVSFARREGDFAGYVLVGELALQGRHIYLDAPPGISTWPPFFSLFCIPLALLHRATPVATRAAWLLVNYAALLVVLRLIVRIVARGPLDQRERAVPPLSSWMAIVPVVLSARYVASNYEHLQINVLMFLLTLWGLVQTVNGKTVHGSLALGLAAACKVMPFLFVPYLLWRRQWRAAGLTTLVTAVLTLSPALVYGWSRLLDYFGAWRAALGTGWAVGKMNLSVYAMWDRIIGHGIVPFAVPGFNDLQPSRSPAVTAVLAASIVVTGLIALWAFRAGRPDDPRAMLAEWSAVLIIASLFSTVGWKAYLVVLLLPNALLLDAWRSGDLDAATRRTAVRVALAAFIIGVLTTDGLVGRRLGWRLEMGSIVTLAGLVMLGGMFWLRRRIARV